MAAQNSAESHVLNTEMEPTDPPKSAEASSLVEESFDPPKEVPPVDLATKPDDKPTDPPKFAEASALVEESLDPPKEVPPADMEIKPDDTISEVRSGGGEKVQEEGEEEGECGFCLFMKGGGCKEAFISWEKCVEETEEKKEDIVEKCYEVTSALKKCMEAHSDYYGPLLQAEKAAEEEAIRQLEEEKQKEAAETESPIN